MKYTTSQVEQFIEEVIEKSGWKGYELTDDVIVNIYKGYFLIGHDGFSTILELLFDPSDNHKVARVVFGEDNICVACGYPPLSCRCDKTVCIYVSHLHHTRIMAQLDSIEAMIEYAMDNRKGK